MTKRCAFALCVTIALAFLAAPRAHAFDKGKLGSFIVLHCDYDVTPEPGRADTFSLDLSTMKGSLKEMDREPQQLVLRWVGDGPVLRIDDIDNGRVYPDYNFNLETGIPVGLDLDTGQPGGIGNIYTATDPITGEVVEHVPFPKPCHDDHGLVPAPQYTDAGRAQIAAESRPSIDEAKAAAKKLTAVQKAQAKAKFVQAFDLYKAGDFDAAILGFKQGLDIDPSSGLANFYLGECYARANKDYLARVRWQRTIDLEPSSKEALQAQSRLAKQ